MASEDAQLRAQKYMLKGMLAEAGPHAVKHYEDFMRQFEDIKKKALEMGGDKSDAYASFVIASQIFLIDLVG